MKIMKKFTCVMLCFALLLSNVVTVRVFANVEDNELEQNTNKRLPSSNENTINSSLLSDTEEKVLEDALCEHMLEKIDNGEDLTVDKEEFINYAIEKGLIDNNPQIIQSLYIDPYTTTKAMLRAEFKACATAGRTLGYTFAAECLNHSLDSNPNDVTYYSNSLQSYKVKTSSAYKNLVSSLGKTLKVTSTSSYSDDGSFILSDPKDVFYAINKADYYITAYKYGGYWEVSIEITDTYNYEMASTMGKGMGGSFATYLNNYATIAQSFGVINEYDITIYTKEMIFQ